MCVVPWFGHCFSEPSNIGLCILFQTNLVHSLNFWADVLAQAAWLKLVGLSEPPRAATARQRQDGARSPVASDFQNPCVLSVRFAICVYKFLRLLIFKAICHVWYFKPLRTYVASVWFAIGMSSLIFKPVCMCHPWDLQFACNQTISNDIIHLHICSIFIYYDAKPKGDLWCSTTALFSTLSVLFMHFLRDTIPLKL